jgi:RimJ/RimL family protein N-acetyltransferase
MRHDCNTFRSNNDGKPGAPPQPPGQAVPPAIRYFPEQLDSERLIIRPARQGDGARLYEAVVASLDDLRRFPASMRWAMREQTLPGTEQYCRDAYAHFLLRDHLFYLLLLKGSDTVIGCCGLYRINWDVPSCQLGYWGRTPFQGHGLITEGVRTLVEFAFNELGMRRVETWVDDLNQPSWRVCQRLGFELEGLLRNERIDPDGTLRNTRIYSQIR